MPPALVPFTSVGDLSTAPALGGSGCGTGVSLRGVGGPLTYFLSGRLNKSKLKAIELCLFYFFFFHQATFLGVVQLVLMSWTVITARATGGLITGGCAGRAPGPPAGCGWAN